MSKVIKYSIPYNGDLELMKWAINRGQVHEVYFAGPGDCDYSVSHPEESIYSQDDIIDLICLCVDHGVGRNFFINKYTFYWDNVKDIFAYIKGLEKYFVCQNIKFPKGFVEKVLYCRSACENCDYCERVAKKTFLAK